MIAACISGIVSMIVVYIMPESPKFLITKKKYDEARVAINWIARFNARDEIFDSKFDREVLDLKAAARRRDWTRETEISEDFSMTMTVMSNTCKFLDILKKYRT